MSKRTASLCIPDSKNLKRCVSCSIGHRPCSPSGVAAPPASSTRASSSSSSRAASRTSSRTVPPRPPAKQSSSAEHLAPSSSRLPPSSVMPPPPSPLVSSRSLPFSSSLSSSFFPPPDLSSVAPQHRPAVARYSDRLQIGLMRNMARFLDSEADRRSLVLDEPSPGSQGESFPLPRFLRADSVCTAFLTHLPLPSSDSAEPSSQSSRRVRMVTRVGATPPPPQGSSKPSSGRGKKRE